MKINIDDLTLGQVQQILSRFSGGAAPMSSGGHPYKIGACYIFRTVTMIQTGRLVEVYDQELLLEEAAWIADTGRFSESLKSLDFNEVEPFPDGHVGVGRGSIVDFCEIAHTIRDLK